MPEGKEGGWEKPLKPEYPEPSEPLPPPRDTVSEADTVEKTGDSQDIDSNKERDRGSNNTENLKNFRVDLDKPSANDDIRSMQFNKIHSDEYDRDMFVFVGTIQGHNVQVQRNVEAGAEEKYIGIIDKTPLEPGYAEELYGYFSEVRK